MSDTAPTTSGHKYTKTDFQDLMHRGGLLSKKAGSALDSLIRDDNPHGHGGLLALADKHHDAQPAAAAKTPGNHLGNHPEKGKGSQG